MKASRWVLASRPNSSAVAEHLQLEETQCPAPNAGEFVIAPMYLRAAPPMLNQMVSGGLAGTPVPLGSPVTGAGIGRVIESNHPDFPVGELVNGAMPWQDRVLSDGAQRVPVQAYKPVENLPPTTAFHVLGPPGLTAYFGVYEYAKPRVGDTLVVSTAAGSVGAVVCQLGKLLGCRVIGITGSQQKCDWLTSEAGVDAVIDYRQQDVHAELTKLCPDGIDIYFDNVGGEILDAALDLIAFGARVVLCGASSQYANTSDWSGPKNYFNLVYKQADMQGFYIFNFRQQFPDATARLAALVTDGKLKYAEDIVDGLENAPMAFERVLRSENLGTQLVRVAD